MFSTRDLRLAFLASVVASICLLRTPTVAKEYKLDVGDSVEYDILNDEDPARQLTIDSNGQIQIPLLGGIAVAGLSVSQALDVITREFVSRQLLTDPKIALSVGTLRPIYVLGDVKSPGSFPYQPLITVEQAVGLAGGILVASTSGEDAIIARTRLKGELEANQTDIATAMVAIGRLNAVLGDRTSIADADLPSRFLPFASETTISLLRKTNDKLLAVDGTTFLTQRQLLSEGIVEATKQIDVLQQSVVNQQETIKFSKGELDRAASLLKGGLNTAIEVARNQRQLTADEGRLLAIYAEMSQARRVVGELKRELLELTESRKKDALVQMQDRQAELEKLVTQQRTLEEQIFLTGTLKSELGQSSLDTAAVFTIKHKSGNQISQASADSSTELGPGDILLVAIKEVSDKPQSSN